MTQLNQYDHNSGHPVIAIIDDEEMVTQTIKAFLSLETDYSILTFQSPANAIEKLSKAQPDLVIADFLMPEMNGLEFLAVIKKMYPDVPLILLTGYADKENAIKGINEVGLYQYIQKPWDNENLKMVIKNGLENKNLELALKEKIKEIDSILLQREELFQVNNLLQEEVSLAKRIHAKLVGPQSLEANGISVNVLYKPTFEIGGDYYDIMSLSNNRLAVIIADLTGHGIQAALCTALLKFAFNDFKETYATIELIVKGMNDVLYRGLPGDVFAAALIVVINTETNTCEIINCGIPYPVYLERENRKIHKVPVNGYLLGMINDELYEPGNKETIYLNKNDCLFLYTDGLTEAKNDKGKMIDKKHIYKIIEQNIESSREFISKELINSVITFKGSRQFVDDLTLLSIERK
ncbi:SpoIIE family protein phosphatase [candidate division KSB1 bacterium]|nr:SpoIIE family protein phosphatase [candidate division KSB1 bacterium]